MARGRRFALFASCALLLASCAGAPAVVEPEREEHPSRTHTITVVSHGWHTGVIVAGADANRAIPELATRFGEPDFYEIGWGDKGFYQAAEITSGLTMRAMFWSSGAVVHVVAMRRAPEQFFFFDPLVTVDVSERELASLHAFLAASFARGVDGHVVDLRPGIYGDSEFYGGVGRYHLLHTCNTWTAKALRSAGIEIHPAFTLSASGVMDFLEDDPRSHVVRDERAAEKVREAAARTRP